MSDKVKSNKCVLKSRLNINNISPGRSIAGEFIKGHVQEKWKMSEKAEEYLCG